VVDRGKVSFRSEIFPLTLVFPIAAVLGSYKEINSRISFNKPLYIDFNIRSLIFKNHLRAFNAASNPENAFTGLHSA